MTNLVAKITLITISLTFCINCQKLEAGKRKRSHKYNKSSHSSSLEILGEVASFQYEKKLLNSIRTGDDKLVRELVNKEEDLYVKDECDNNIFHRAVKSKNYNLLIFLISSISNKAKLKEMINAENKNGKSPLSLITQNTISETETYNPFIIAILLFSNGAEINGQDPLESAGILFTELAMKEKIKNLFKITS